MTVWLGGVVFMLALPCIATALYLLLLTLLSRAPPTLAPASRRWRFDVVVPAHDEAVVIAAALASLRRLDWPAEYMRVLVVADNCSDATAAIARESGAVVLERNDTRLRGKGHALAFAFQASVDFGWADALVVIDADTEVSSNLLEMFARHLDQGAGAVQAHYGVLNAQASWRTRLMSIAMCAFHQVRSRGRERLGLSCGLRGNGWCLTHAVLAAVPYSAFSLAEDVEYGIELGLAGVRVHYADAAWVAAEMVSAEAASRSQRLRWEHGRRQLRRERVFALLTAAVRGGKVPLDLALDLLVPPLSTTVAQLAFWMLLAGVAWWWNPAWAPWLGLDLACTFMIALYVLRGWQLSGVGPQGLIDLARAPVFVLWKLFLMLRPHAGVSWVRTRREKP
jgi:cellulose synthase/poly-beta-1,6-N-acetylglucosamine synthase-like glycosyltransferase